MSKATLYRQFGDKSTLFVELLTGDMVGADDRIAALADAVPSSDNLAADLQRLPAATSSRSCNRTCSACDVW